MKMAALRWQILLSLCGISQTFGPRKLLNPNDIMFKILKVYKCENFEQVVKVDINYHDDVVDAEFELKDDFTDIYQAALTVDKLEGDEWKRVTDNSGDACAMLDKHFKKPWKKLRENIEPRVTGDCTVEAGSYKITKFGVSREDLSLSVVDTGLYQARVIVSDEFDTELACLMVDAEFSEKQK